MVRLIDWRVSCDGDEEDKFQTLAKYASDRGKPDLLINCDGFNCFTQVLSSLLRPKKVSGCTLTKNMRKTMAWGHEVNQKFHRKQIGFFRLQRAT